jgi:hypothetical protein
MPQNFGGGVSIINVKYLYKIDGLADWTKNVEIHTTFPYVGKSIIGASKQGKTQVLN